MLSAHRSAAAFRHDPTTPLKDDACHVGDPTPRVDTAIVVEGALMRLPVEQRAAVVAVDMQGYSVAETARMLGVAEGTVKSRCGPAPSSPKPSTTSTSVRARCQNPVRTRGRPRWNRTGSAAVEPHTAGPWRTP